MCTGSDILIGVDVGIPLTFNITTDIPTVALHWKCPVSSDWTKKPYIWCNMKESMDNNQTACHLKGVILIIKAANL